jgi:branched-chain amino acid transport system ATP-binding protein
VQRAYVIESGRITISGSAKELENNDEVRRSYLGI